MDVKAIVILADPSDSPSPSSTAEMFAGNRLAVIDVLGQPPALRVIQRLRRYGVSECAVVCGASECKELSGVQAVNGGDAPWRAAEQIFNDFVQKDADIILILRLGPYAEVSFDELIQFHLEHRGHVTATVDATGRSLDIFVISASRRNEAAFLFRHGLRAMRSPATEFVFHGYINWLQRAVDLRQLAVDAFLERNSIQPVGTEVRPGVWVGSGARIHPRARIVAPAYIGHHARIRAAAVVTRFATVEHHAEIDCGTVIENSSIAPFMYVGAGLEIGWSVVGLGQAVANLRRNFEVEIADPKLISTIPANAPLRALGEAASLTAFLPVQLIRGFFSRSRKPHRGKFPSDRKGLPSVPVESAFEPSGEIRDSREFSPNLAVARRYGNE